MRKHQEFRFTCSVCHKDDWSPRAGALYCSNRCKQIAYRKRKAEIELSKKFTLPLETFALFQQITGRQPTLLEPLTQFLREHEQGVFTEVLALLTIAQTT